MRQLLVMLFIINSLNVHARNMFKDTVYTYEDDDSMNKQVFKVQSRSAFGKINVEEYYFYHGDHGVLIVTPFIATRIENTYTNDTLLTKQIATDKREYPGYRSYPEITLTEISYKRRTGGVYDTAVMKTTNCRAYDLPESLFGPGGLYRDSFIHHIYFDDRGKRSVDSAFLYRQAVCINTILWQYFYDEMGDVIERHHTYIEGEKVWLRRGKWRYAEGKCVEAFESQPFRDSLRKLDFSNVVFDPHRAEYFCYSADGLMIEYDEFEHNCIRDWESPHMDTTKIVHNYTFGTDHSVLSEQIKTYSNELSDAIRLRYVQEVTYGYYPDKRIRAEKEYFPSLGWPASTRKYIYR